MLEARRKAVDDSKKQLNGHRMTATTLPFGWTGRQAPAPNRPAPVSKPAWSLPHLLRRWVVLSAGKLADSETETTAVLLTRAKAGDQRALDDLFQRYMGPLKRWAHGRLPAWARDMRDTDDLVQESVMHTLRQVKGFEPRRDGAFLAYLRTALHNKLRDEIRRARRVRREPLATDHADDGPSVVEQVIGREVLERYERCIERLSSEEREAVLARIELGKSYAEIAEVLGKPSPDAARMTVTRALTKLAQEMRRGWPTRHRSSRRNPCSHCPDDSRLRRFANRHAGADQPRPELAGGYPGL